jgi:hypothetical protein
MLPQCQAGVVVMRRRSNAREPAFLLPTREQLWLVELVSEGCFLRNHSANIIVAESLQLLLCQFDALAPEVSATVRHRNVSCVQHDRTGLQTSILRALRCMLLVAAKATSAIAVIAAVVTTVTATAAAAATATMVVLPGVSTAATVAAMEAFAGGTAAAAASARKAFAGGTSAAAAAAMKAFAGATSAAAAAARKAFASATAAAAAVMVSSAGVAVVVCTTAVRRKRDLHLSALCIGVGVLLMQGVLERRDWNRWQRVWTRVEASGWRLRSSRRNDMLLVHSGLQCLLRVRIFQEGRCERLKGGMVRR